MLQFLKANVPETGEEWFDYYSMLRRKVFEVIDADQDGDGQTDKTGRQTDRPTDRHTDGGQTGTARERMREREVVFSSSTAMSMRTLLSSLLSSI